MTATMQRPGDPGTDLRLARLHLRMGQLGLARAALEALAGSGDLDADGLLALAEARWRTGDLTGAGEAAQVYRERGGESIVALVIAAEAVAAVGRPGEARRIAARALERSNVPLDQIFAGMPRSSIWPADSAAGAQPAATLFGADPPRRRPTQVDDRGAERAPDEPRAAAPAGPGFWDTTDEPEALADAERMVDVARRALAEGRIEEAILRLAIVLRADPDLATAVLEATERAPRTAAIEILRGDAFGLAGNEINARRAYAAATAALPGSATADLATDHAPSPADAAPQQEES